MNKWLLALAVIGLLSACSYDENVPEEEPIEEGSVENEEAEGEPTQAELDAKLKEEAEPAVFTELNVDQPPVDKKVTVTGEVSLVTKPGVLGTFSLMSDDGLYTIMNMSDAEVKDGDKVTVYGVVAADKAEDGSPTIHATIIE